MEFTENDKLKIDQNIEKCIKFFQDNKLETENIRVEYNPCENGKRKYNDEILVNKNGTIETGNLWGYHTMWTKLEKLDCYDKMSILKQWQDIKTRFLANRQKIIDQTNLENDLINNFVV